MITYIPTAGTHINQACQKAIDLARKNNESVSFKFNDIPLVVWGGHVADEVARRWQAESDRRLEEYQASPAYVEHQKRRAIEIETKQRVVDVLLSQRFSDFSFDDWMRWLRDFTQSADDIGVKFDERLLVSRLESVGWRRNAWVTKDENVLSQLKSDKKMMAEYVMGQIIDCLSHGMPPHQVTLKFVDEYFAIS